MPCPMNFFPHLLAVLAMLLPPGSGEDTDPIVPGTASVQRADQRDSAPGSFFCPAHLPPLNESFFEYLDESALDLLSAVFRSPRRSVMPRDVASSECVELVDHSPS